MGTLEISIAVGAVLGAASAWIATGPARRRKRAVEEALGQARALVEKSPDDDGARVRLARVQLEIAKRPDDALATLGPVLERNRHHWTEGEKPTLALVGDALADQGRLDEAIETFESFVGAIGEYETGGDSERKWQLETHKVEAEQRIRLLKRGDTHVHRPEQWGDAN